MRSAHVWYMYVFIPYEKYIHWCNCVNVPRSECVKMIVTAFSVRAYTKRMYTHPHKHARTHIHNDFWPTNIFHPIRLHSIVPDRNDEHPFFHHKCIKKKTILFFFRRNSSQLNETNIELTRTYSKLIFDLWTIRLLKKVFFFVSSISVWFELMENWISLFYRRFIVLADYSCWFRSFSSFFSYFPHAIVCARVYVLLVNHLYSSCNFIFTLLLELLILSIVVSCYSRFAKNVKCISLSTVALSSTSGMSMWCS